MKTLQSVIITLVLLTSTVATADIAGDPEKIPGQVVAMQQDATGAVVRGSLQRLVRSVRAGADIKILIDDPALDQQMQCDTLIIYTSAAEEHVACSVNRRSSILDEASLPSIIPRGAGSFWTALVFTTESSFVLERTTFTGSAAGTTTGTQYNLTWFASVR